jgi:hypothetical protein
MARLRLLLALALIGVGTTFGALALSGYYNPGAQDQLNVASTDRPGSQLVRARPRQRLVAADTHAATTSTPTRVTTQATAATTATTEETLPWAKAKPVKLSPREPSKPKDAKDATKRPQQASASWPWNLFSN